MLFLDLDGTVLDVRRRHYAAYVSVCEMRDVKGIPIPEAEYWHWRREAKPVADIIAASKVFPTKRRLYQARFDERLEVPELLLLDTLKTGVETFLGKVYTKTPICLVTLRRDKEALESQLASMGLSRYFASVLAGVPPTPRRPEKGLRGRHKAQLIRDRYRLLPTEALYIGDTETDVEAAKDLGFDVFLVEGGHRQRSLQIKANPDRLVADLPAALKYMLTGGRWMR
ncbi:MAG: HAD hydrolase-like protein [Myxococcota bacterium]